MVDREIGVENGDYTLIEDRLEFPIYRELNCLMCVVALASYIYPGIAVSISN